MQTPWVPQGVVHSQVVPVRSKLTASTSSVKPSSNVSAWISMARIDDPVRPVPPVVIQLGLPAIGALATVHRLPSTPNICRRGSNWMRAPFVSSATRTGPVICQPPGVVFNERTATRSSFAPDALIGVGAL